MITIKPLDITLEIKPTREITKAYAIQLALYRMACSDEGDTDLPWRETGAHQDGNSWTVGLTCRPVPGLNV